MSWDPSTHYKDIAVAERYDRDRFGSLAGRVFNALEKRCIAKAFDRLSREAIVVDVPCGTGRFAEVLLEMGFTVVGVDISPAMLHVARGKLERFGARFEGRVADVKQLPQAEGRRFDAALCARVLMHFPLDEQIRFLRSVAQVTKGRIVFNQSLDSGYQRLRRRIKRILGTQAPARYPIGERDLQRLLRGAGLKEVGRLRPMALLSEAIFVIAEPA